MPWFPEYNKPGTHLIYWDWHVFRESVKLTAKVTEPLPTEKKGYYYYTLFVRFDLRKIRYAKWDNRRIKLYFRRDDFEWNVKKNKIKKGKVKSPSKKNSFTQYDDDNVLEIHLRDMEDNIELGEAFNYYINNWSSRAYRKGQD